MLVVTGGGHSPTLLRSHGVCGTGQRLDASDLHSLVEVDVHGLGSSGDLQVLHATSEGPAGGESGLTTST